jgi:hypothetical protein
MFKLELKGGGRRKAIVNFKTWPVFQGDMVDLVRTRMWGGRFSLLSPLAFLPFC